MGEGLRILFYDNHLALDHAYELAKEGHEVYYFHEWRYRYGRVEDLIGTGLHKNLFVVPDIWAKVNDCDLAVIADVGYGYLGKYLRNLGLPVFGGNIFGDALENSRLYAASLMDDFGIKHPKYYEVVGVEKLREVAERLDYDFFLKVDMVRGNLETVRVKSRAEMEISLDSANFGPFKDIVRFIVSEPIDGVEVGCDAWFNGKEFVRPYHFGNEVKGTGCCFGKWVSESVWDGVLKRFENMLYGKYFGTISFEAIYDGSDLYVIDVTSRFARPAGAMQYFCNRGRYGEILRRVASSESVEVSEWPLYTVQLSLDFPEPEKWYKLMYHPNLAISEFAVGVGGNVWVHNRDQLRNIVHYLGCGDDLYSLLNKSSAEAFSLAKKMRLLFSDSAVIEFYNTMKKFNTMGIDF